MSGFRLDYHREAAPAEEPERRSIFRGGVELTPPPFHSDEAAARHHLSLRLAQDGRQALRGMSAPRPGIVLPDLKTTSTEESPLSNTRTVAFEQTRSGVSIFGTRVVVELDAKREMVGFSGELQDTPNVASSPTVTQAEAFVAVLTASSVDADALTYDAVASLTYFQGASDAWHLCFHFVDVPLSPRDPAPVAANAADMRHGCGVSHSLRARHPMFAYLVDAHTGTVMYFYSVAPTAADPVHCTGIDENGNEVEFFGLKETDAFLMWDPWRKIKTYDYGFNDIAVGGPTSPIAATAAEFTSPAAVSAHVNATAVYDFYNSVLQRSSVDGNGMELISNVNCVSSDEATPGKPRQWENAAWWKGKMWYGQIENANGVRSFSRHLDIIAHELTHGVTEVTAGLIYREQPGALNESFSDIFGVFIKNWTAGRQKSVDDWDWTIGMSLGRGGGPLRDMSDPTRTADPAHMNDFVKSPVTDRGDWGGVHTNSNIHNLAAYHLLTAVTAAGKRVLSPRDAAVIYYLCLTRLNKTATFGHALAGLINAANSYFAGNSHREAVVDAIRDAYGKVGIV